MRILPELVAKINAWSDAIHTLTATVDLEPTAGSVYSGVIKEYHDVKGFILLQTALHAPHAGAGAGGADDNF